MFSANLGQPGSEEPQDARRALTVTHEGVVDAYVGWRCWWISANQGRGQLVSLVVGNEWRPGTNLATCPWCDTSPSADCRCGFYAYRHPQGAELIHFAKVYAQSMVAFGEIRMWGKVVVHETGYRAEKAKIASLVKMPRSGERYDLMLGLAAETYGVPICLLD